MTAPCFRQVNFFLKFVYFFCSFFLSDRIGSQRWLPTTARCRFTHPGFRLCADAGKPEVQLLQGKTHPPNRPRPILTRLIAPKETENGNQNQQSTDLDAESDINRTNLIVNYLPQYMTDKDLYTLFVSQGPIDNVRIMKDYKVRWCCQSRNRDVSNNNC